MDDRELIVTRRIEAPRELVFAAFTDARHIDRKSTRLNSSH